MAAVIGLSDTELRRRLSEYGVNVGPVTDTTRKIYARKLEKLIAKGGSSEDLVSAQSSKPRRSLASGAEFSDSELRRRLSEYGVTVGPVTDTTRKLYTVKLQKLIAEDGSGEESFSGQALKSRRSLSRGSSVGQTLLDRSNSSPSADELSDGELRSKLWDHGVAVGPVTSTTKGLYLRKLQKLVSEPAGGQKNGPSATGKANSRPSLSRFSSEESDADEPTRKSMPPPATVSRPHSRSLGRVVSDTSSVLPQLDISDTEPEPWKRGSLYPDLSSHGFLNKPGGILSSRAGMLGRTSTRFSTSIPSRSDGFDTGSDSDVPEHTYSTSRKYDYGPRFSAPRSSFLDNFSSFTSKFSAAFSKDGRGAMSGKDKLPAARFGGNDATSSARSTGFRDSGNSGYASAFTQKISSQLSHPLDASSSRYSTGSSLYHSSPVSVNDVKERDVAEEARSVVGSSNGLYGSRSFSFGVKPRELSREFRTEDSTKWWYNSQTVSMALLCVVLLFFLVLGVVYMSVHSSDGVSFYDQEGNNYPVCKDDDSVTPCIERENLRSTVELSRCLLEELTQRAVSARCMWKSEPALMTQEEVVLWLHKNGGFSGGGDIQAKIMNVKIMFLSRPEWGVDIIPVGRTEAAGLGEFADHKDVIARGGLLVRDPQLPVACYLWQKLSSFLFYVVILAGGAVGLYGCKVLGSWYLSRARERQRAIHDMVHRILTLLESNHQSGGHSYLAINHVRDQLINPWDRDKLAWVWNEAVTFLEQKESRVRCEVQQVAGEEFRVWRWLPSRGRTTPPFTPPSSPDQGQALKQNKVWQGQAFETMEGSPNSPLCSPTPCLKIRHMFDVEIEYGEEWPVRIRDAILEKCEGINILHISVDRQSRDGCVYVKCPSQRDAGMAYKRLHGSWFDGKLVTVKYLRVERYHERFPDAVRAVMPLKPSNNKKLSLQSRQEPN